MPDKTWKAAERRICELFGGARRGATGRDQSDCVHDCLAIEVKCNRNQMPQYIQQWVAQAVANAEAEHTPMVVWHNVGDEYLDALVLLRVRDFLPLLNEGG